MTNKKYFFRQMVDGELETYFATSLEGLKQEMLKFLKGFGITPPFKIQRLKKLLQSSMDIFTNPWKLFYHRKDELS